MDIEKLIERLRTDSLCADKATLEIMDLCMEAADALSALQAENEKLPAGAIVGNASTKMNVFAALNLLGEILCLSKHLRISSIEFLLLRPAKGDRPRRSHRKVPENQGGGGQHGQAENLRGAWG